MVARLSVAVSLERAFESLLIERSKKKFRLTREGQVFYDFSKQIIQNYEALFSRLQEIKEIISGTVRVATLRASYRRRTHVLLARGPLAKWNRW